MIIARTMNAQPRSRRLWSCCPCCFLLGCSNYDEAAPRELPESSECLPTPKSPIAQNALGARSGGNLAQTIPAFNQVGFNKL